MMAITTLFESYVEGVCAQQYGQLGFALLLAKSGLTTRVSLKEKMAVAFAWIHV